MEQYINAVLVKIDENRVVVIEGEEYLLLNQKQPPTSKPVEKTKKAATKKRPKAEKLTKEEREALEAATFAILHATPNMRAGAIRTELAEKYLVNVNPLTLSYALSKLKNKGLLEVTGYKQTATWAVKTPSFNEAVTANPNSLVPG